MTLLRHPLLSELAYFLYRLAACLAACAAGLAALRNIAGEAKR